ncbi:MAG: protein kinase [Deltaproteobacteria bacterium]|nr:protein kinase [Deltaproteobacteria bacterium]
MEMPKKCGERFSIFEQIEKRPSCVVSKANDSSLEGRVVAVKVFVDRPDKRTELVERFQAEVAKLSAASHPALVPILDSGVAEGFFYLAMEYIERGTLHDLLREKKKIPWQDALSHIIYLAEGIKEIHQAGYVHAHIDSRAILFKGDKPCLAGYYPLTIGIIQKDLTSDGRFIVQPAYIAPEQMSGSDKLDGRVDIYALSIIFYEMITGERPFSGSTPFQMALHRMSHTPNSPMSLESSVPPLLDAAILKGLAKNPSERFSSMEDFISTLMSVKHSDKAAPVSATLGAASRLGSETIAVSISSDVVKQMLAAHEQNAGNSQPQMDSSKTMVGATLSGQQTQTMSFDKTMVGVDRSMLLAGSLVVVAGENIGKKIDLVAGQILLGSDASCQVAVKEKGVAARTALLARRNGSYFLAPLITTALSLNGSDIKNQNEIELKRGDIIGLGKTSLRFVAPGEVFTFQEDKVERSIDRKTSKTISLLTVVGIAIVVVVGGMIYQYSKYQNAMLAKRKAQMQNDTNEKQMLVKQLVQEGYDLLKKGNMLEPVGNSANDRFRQVLDMEPDNDQAKRGLEKIEALSKKAEEEEKLRAERSGQIARYISDGDAYFRDGKLISPPGANARAMFEEALRLDPSNETAKKRLTEIDKMIGDVLARVDTLLEQAESYKRMGQYVEPESESAYKMVQEVLKIDAQNTRAKTMLIEMAALSIYHGDVAKTQLKREEMHKYYNTAEMLGVDPAFVEPRYRGSDLIGKSNSDIVIVSKGKDESSAAKTSDKYLDTEEIKKRVKALEVRLGSPDAVANKKLITVDTAN